MSLCRQNYHEECEAGINKQINLELYASYVYSSMLMDFQNKRGGRIVLQDIKKPEKDEWGSGLEAMKAALDLEKHVNDALIKLEKTAESHGDSQMSDFLEDYFLKEQVESIREISGYVANLKRVGPGLGEYQFDHETLGEV